MDRTTDLLYYSLTAGTGRPELGNSKSPTNCPLAIKHDPDLSRRSDLSNTLV